MTEYQLRIYSIKPDGMTEFIEGWRQYIVPMREKFNFKVLYAFSNQPETEFIWLLAWEGPEGFAEADAIYYQNPERQAIAWDPNKYIAHKELRIIQGIPIHPHAKE